MNKTLMFGGIILILMGISIYLCPRYYDFKYARYVDFTGYNKPYGIALAAAGILFIWKSLTKEYKPDRKVTLICPKCDEAFELKESSDKRCPKCGTDIEPLKGFYERHPERKQGAEPRQRKQDK